ncbi:phage tail length tape measure family protein [Rhizobium mongolense]|uniref:Molecular chaperone GrpE (Heat shock protein) n=1 Tax=Rhizobium mongolense TaxID=57676 RepID=A0A7W6WGQ4_9HYPH|nr:phage tail length tape measure family protein [Rhizobium mongolense]MBB4277024.1 molecular chaperone GrpE (heat shock protein) [Rhizobium mongolense]
MAVGQMSDLMFRIVGNDNSRAAFDSANRNADTFGKKGASAGREASRAIDSVRNSTANLAAQFNDIGVQLQSGTSPFTVALQQGTQIGQVLGPLGAGGAVRALGGAFLSLLSPVNLATIGLIAVGGAAFQYFSSLYEDGDKAAEALKEQNELIASVATAWGDAVPALRDYVDQLERAKEQSDLINASSSLADNQWAVARRDVADLNVELAALVADLQAAGAENETILALQNAWNSVSQSVADGKENTEAMNEVQAALAAALEETGIPAVGAFGEAFNGLVQSIAGAVRQASIFRTEALNALTVGKFGPQLGQLGPMWSENGKLMKPEDFAVPGSVPTPGRRPSDLDQFPGGGFSRPRSGGGGGKSDEERQAENIQKIIQSLEDEQDMIGQSKVAQRTLQLQRRANVEATSAEGQAIANLVSQISEEEAAYKSAKEAGDFMRDNLKQAFSDLLPEIDTGNKALDGFINRLIQASTEAMFFGSGPLAGFFGGGGGFLRSIFGGGRAVGGGVEPWTDYLVGENGPEVLRIGARGGVVGSAEKQEAQQMSYAPVYNIDARGADAGAVARLERGLKERDKTEAKRVAGYNHARSTRGTRP